jgi:hypothetical protein
MTQKCVVFDASDEEGRIAFMSLRRYCVVFDASVRATKSPHGSRGRIRVGVRKRKADCQGGHQTTLVDPVAVSATEGGFPSPVHAGRERSASRCDRARVPFNPVRPGSAKRSRSGRAACATDWITTMLVPEVSCQRIAASAWAVSITVQRAGFERRTMTCWTPRSGRAIESS